MKRSELKELVKEAMLEILPDLMEIMVENMRDELHEAYSPPESVKQKPDLDYIRQAYKPTTSASEYTGLGEIPNRTTSTKAPKNPKAIIEGESFASGKGIMDWFQNSVSKDKPKVSEFKHSEKQMQEFMSKKFGV